LAHHQPYQSLTSLQEKKLLLRTNSTKVDKDGLVSFSVKRCGNTNHYIVFDPHETFNIGAVDDISRNSSGSYASPRLFGFGHSKDGKVSSSWQT